MKKYLLALTICSIAVLDTACAQTDNDYIGYAAKALQVTKNCDEATNSLNKVSVAGKQTSAYMLCMANTSDCSQNNEQAIFYYEQYLKQYPANDSVKKRVAELKDKKAKDTKVATEVQNAKYMYEVGKSKKGKVSKKKSKHSSIYDNFSLLGMSYDVALGGAKAPYKSAVSMISSTAYPIIHDRVTLGYAVSFNYMFSPNKNWFARVYGITPDQVEGVNTAFAMSASFQPAAVIVNKRKISLTAGPEVGFGLYYTPENISGGATFDDGASYGVTYGARANLFLGKNLGFYLAYGSFSRKDVSVTRAAAIGTVSEYTPTNRDVLQLGISVRFDNWWWGRGWW